MRHTGSRRLETERLVLRKFEYSDVDCVLKYWAGDPGVQAMYGEPVYATESEVNGLLDKYIAAYSKDDCYRWAVILKETGECIGQIAYFLVDSRNEFAEIEYCIGSPFQRKGLATEATMAVIDFGFSAVNLHKVQISHKSINLASKRVIEKCGFKYEGTLRDYFYTDGKYIDRLFYSILRDEWESIKARAE